MNQSEIQEWNDFAHYLRRLARWDLERIDHALKEALRVLPELEEPSRSNLLKMGRVVGERSSKLALQFLRLAPGALQRISGVNRPSFLRWAATLALNSRESLVEFFDRGPEILDSLTMEDGARFLDLGKKLAEKDWAVSLKFFLNLNKISIEIKNDNVVTWFEAGLALLFRNPAAALAYFSLESKQAWQNGGEADNHVSFQEIAGPLKILVQALTGKPMGIRSLKETEGKGSVSPAHGRLRMESLYFSRNPKTNSLRLI